MFAERSCISTNKGASPASINVYRFFVFDRILQTCGEVLIATILLESWLAMIEFRNVSKIYPNGTVGLKNINLQIEKGEFVVIVGLSGAGKSTLLRAINRLHEVSEGDIRLAGQSITAAKGQQLRLLRRDIGMIFQSFNLVKRSTVLRNVLAGRVGYNSTWRTLLGLFPKSEVELALDALDRVNIREKAYSRADELSGGQQQRVSIARALAQEAKVILADEPVASLDPLTTRQVMDDLKRINQELGITTIVNLHFVDLAREYATRIIGLRAGEVVFDGPVHEATDEAFSEIYGRRIQVDELLGVHSG
jgi:phosphonate transport system ATP-binding protein